MSVQSRRRFAKHNRRARARFVSLRGIEALEQRAMLAVFNPLAGAIDGAAGSLRAAIVASNANGQNDTIPAPTRWPWPTPPGK